MFAGEAGDGLAAHLVGSSLTASSMRVVHSARS